MISFKTVIIIITTVIAVTSAWSTQLPQFFHALLPSPQTPPPPPPPLIRSFFQDPLVQPRFYVHHNQPALQYYRPPLQFYQPPPPQPAVSVTRLQLQTPLRLHVPATGVHHHHHVFHYYYLPVDGETQSDGRRDGGVRGTAVRRPCDNHPNVDTTVCPPTMYLPPASLPLPLPSPPPPVATLPPPPSTTPPSPPPPTTPPSPPPPTTLAPSPPTTSPPAEDPCEDDTVIVDNVNYYPFSGHRAPIVVATATVLRDATVHGNDTANNRKPEIKSNFILANYLLPPDK